MGHFLLGMCSWLLRTSAVFKPSLSAFRQDRNGMGAVYYILKYGNNFFVMNLPVYESLLAIIFVRLKSQKCVTPF